MEGPEFALWMKPRLANVAWAGRAARGACALVLADEAALDRLELCVVEALNNAVEHGPPDGRIELRLRLSRHGFIEVEVRDEGEPIPGDRLADGAPPLPRELADWAECGHGLRIIRSAMGALSYSRRKGRNVLSFRQRVPTVLR